MKKLVFAALTIVLTVLIVVSADAQNVDRYTGTAVIYGSGFNTRTVVSNFDINLKGYTSDGESEAYSKLLADGGQSKLADELSKKDLGTVQFSGRLGPRVVAVFRGKDGDRDKMTVVFERWISFGEVRYGARSTDYPFGVIEIFFDPDKNEGEGTFIGAAKIRLGKNDSSGEREIELVGFGTFPGKVFGVKQRENRSQ
jgi:hypothetical protein